VEYYTSAQDWILLIAWKSGIYRLLRKNTMKRDSKLAIYAPCA
jgi:hypothetical protein